MGVATYLHSVACTTSRFCLAVGSYSTDGSSNHNRALSEEWDGQGWTVLDTPGSPPNAVLEGVACASPTSCIAVGSETSTVAGAQRALAVRWDGTSLSAMSVPSPPGDTGLSAIACPASRRCIAAGSTKRGELPAALVETWNGQEWALGAAAVPAGSVDSSLNSIACQTPSSCVAVGASSTSGDHDDPVSTTLVETWDGSAWSVDPSPTPGSGNLGSLASVACTSLTMCVAVGNYSATNNAYGDDTQALIEAGDRGPWATVDAHLETSAQSALQAVVCPSPATCAAVGSAPQTAYGVANAVLEVWKGGTWSRVSSRLSGVSLESLSCPSDTSCLGVGERAGGATALAVWWRPPA